MSIGLINKALPSDALDQAVDHLAQRLLGLPQMALRATKRLTNLELKRLADSLLDKGMGWESETVRSPEHRSAIAAMRKAQDG